MKSILNIKIARSLCAVFLVFGVLFFSFTKASATGEETTERTETVDTSNQTMYDPDSKHPYKYYIEIEFGAMQFYYDYGEWNPSTHRYEADTTSIDPAAGKTAGDPGWYGFDGTNNKITIKATSGVNNTALKVNVSFSMEDKEIHDVKQDFPLQNGCVFMTCYTDAEMENAITETTEGVTKIKDNAYVVSLENGESAEEFSRSFYVSFSGEPRKSDGTAFHSVGVAKGIGYLIFAVEKPETITENQNGDTSQ